MDCSLALVRPYFTSSFKSFEQDREVRPPFADELAALPATNLSISLKCWGHGQKQHLAATILAQSPSPPPQLPIESKQYMQWEEGENAMLLPRDEQTDGVTLTTLSALSTSTKTGHC